MVSFLKVALTLILLGKTVDFIFTSEVVFAFEHQGVVAS